MVPELTETQLLSGLVAIAVILIVGRGSAEAARLVKQPEVLGELIGGFVLGPSVLGALFPSEFHAIFENAGVGDGLSILSWIGAILVLFLAGLEVDVHILRQQIKPGAFTAVFAIVPSLVAGTLFSWYVLGHPPPAAFFLGIVLSVTGVSVASKILIERNELRRDFAQVILAAGIASEVLVWLLIAIVSAYDKGSPLIAGLKVAVLAVLFFAFMITIGRRVTFWIMRRVADRSALVRGPLTVVLILTFLSAGLTQILGLHALLGAFVFGVIIAQSPRSNPQLRENLQTLTVGLVGPIFFVLAGMRVDIFSLGSFSTVGTFLLLFAVATVVKAGLGATGALLGGLPRWQAVLVGVGVNLKGGTDVVVAILGFELGLFSGKTYAMYAVLAILTVVVSPPAISFLAKRVKPEPAEEERLNREEARRRSYVPGIERVIVPLVPELLPAAASALVERIAAAKATCDEILDITRLGLSVSREAGQVAEERGTAVPSPVEGDEAEVKKAALEVNEAASKLAQASDHADELTDVRIKVTSEDALEKILDAADGHDLIAMGARRPKPDVMLTLGDLQDRIIDGAKTDVLVAVTDEPEFPGPIRRILVPVSGLRYSMDAGDLAAYLAKASGAELVLFNVITSTLEPIHWGQSDRRQLLASGYRILSELKFTVSRLDIDVRERVELSSDPAAAIVRELQQESYQLVVLGSIDRSADHKIMLGNPVQTILTEGNTPAVLLVSHPEPVEQPVA